MGSLDDSGGLQASTPLPSRTVVRDLDRAARGTRKALALVVAGVGAIVGVILVGYLDVEPEPDAIRQLAEPERRALYERTLETLRSTCRSDTRPPGLGAFCRDQAAFITRFPECAAACRAAIEAAEPEPAR